MLIGPQTYPMMRDLRARDAATIVAAGGGRPKAVASAAVRQAEQPADDYMVMAMMMPCCGLGVWPELPTADRKVSLRETLSDMLTVAYLVSRMAAPAVAFAVRSGVFLISLLMLGTLGAAVFHLLALQ